MYRICKYMYIITFALFLFPSEVYSAVDTTVNSDGFIFRCYTSSYDSLFKADVVEVCTDTFHISIPQWVEDGQGNLYKVSYISKEAFSKLDCENLNITYPHSISHTGYQAFGGNENIKVLSINGAITHISSFTFAHCSSLEHLKVSSVEVVGYGAFLRCKSLKDISFIDSVKVIEEHAFAECGNIDTLVMPDCLCKLGFRAFAHCSNLKFIKFSKSIKYIRTLTFDHCIGLTEIYFPENIERIGRNAFRGCSNLKKVKVSKNTVVEENAFPEDTIVEIY